MNRLTKKVVINILKVIVIIVLVVIIFNLSKNNIKDYKKAKEEELILREYEKNKVEENFFFKNALNCKYENQDSKTPYIPEGFEHVTGEWNTGYVIKDKNGNEFVWVPSGNEENDEIIKLDRYDFEKVPLISKIICNHKNYESFIISALENGGFYISRYEIGNENEIPVSKPNTSIWKNITRTEAEFVLEKLDNDENLKLELINGYAYDTTLKWIEKSNDEIELTINNFSKEQELKTGRIAYNNIFDLFDNVMELTSENNYETIILRGIVDDEKELVKDEEIINSRFSILEDEYFFDYNGILGFRAVLYK